MFSSARYWTQERDAAQNGMTVKVQMSMEYSLVSSIASYY